MDSQSKLYWRLYVSNLTLCVCRVSTWDATITEQPPRVDYDQVQERGLGQLLKHIVRHALIIKDTTN